MAHRIDTANEGLDAYVYMAKTFADTPWLHYGMWDPDERVVMPNVRKAQERYVDKLMSLFPAPPARVFDIGGGTGAMAAHLSGLGYEVEMLTPSGVQINEAREKLGDDFVLHHKKFEDYDGPGGFDVLLFSESFQYVPLEQSLPKLKSLLKPDGVVIIADCFRGTGYRDGDLVPGGGHRYTDFEKAVPEYGFAFDQNIDVTEAVAPSMSIDQQFYRGFLGPLIEQLSAMLRHRSRFLHWLAGSAYKLFTSADSRYRMQERLKADYRSPENFKRANTYRFIRLVQR